MNTGYPRPLLEEYYYNEAYDHNNDTDFNALCGKEGVYTQKNSVKKFREADQYKDINDLLPILTMPEPVPKAPSSYIFTNGKPIENFLFTNGKTVEKVFFPNGQPVHKVILTNGKHILDKSASFTEGSLRVDRESISTGKSKKIRLERRHTAARLDSRGERSGVLTQFSRKNHKCQVSDENKKNEGITKDFDHGIAEENDLFKFMEPMVCNTNDNNSAEGDRPIVTFLFRRPMPPRTLRERELGSTPGDNGYASTFHQIALPIPMEDQVNHTLDIPEFRFLNSEDNCIDV